jgi:antitoxin component HigA of HigAB toxin-antitoxin module
MLLKRLQDHFLGKIKLDNSQVTVGLGLLKKTMPDLAATELSGSVERTTVIRAPETVSDTKAWLEKYGPKQADLADSPTDDVARH